MISAKISSFNLIVLLIGATAIAFAPIFAKLSVDFDTQAIDGITPTGVAFWRMALAFPFFAIFVWTRPKQRPSSAPASYKPWMFLLPGILFAMDLSVWHWSFEFTKVANTTLEANLSSIIIGIFSFVVLKERYSWHFIVGVVLALGGLGLLLGFSFTETPGELFGHFLGIVTAFCYASYLLSVSFLARQHSVATVLMWTTGIGSLCLVPLMLMTPERFFPKTADAWWSLLGLALVAQVLGQGLIAYCLSKIRASIAGVLLLWQPMMAAVLGVLILEQSLESFQIFGGLTVLMGLGFVKVARVKVSHES